MQIQKKSSVSPGRSSPFQLTDSSVLQSFRSFEKGMTEAGDPLKDGSGGGVDRI